MMLQAVMSAAKDQARQTARSAALTVAGGVLCLVGLGFLTAALWIVLATEYGALIAALVLGGLYLILGGAVLAFGREPQSRVRPEARPVMPQEPPAAPPRPSDPWLDLAEGFARGLQAGREIRRDRR